MMTVPSGNAGNVKTFLFFVASTAKNKIHLTHPGGRK